MSNRPMEQRLFLLPPKVQTVVQSVLNLQPNMTVDTVVEILLSCAAQICAEWGRVNLDDYRLKRDKGRYAAEQLLEVINSDNPSLTLERVIAAQRERNREAPRIIQPTRVM